MLDVIVLIPAYQPGQHLVDLVGNLGTRQIVVVDDGSGPKYAAVFDKARGLGAAVVTHDRNRGKGYALRTGFAYVRDRYPDQPVVCADSDGQHRAEDIDAVADLVTTSGAAMVLGIRRFTSEVPARSRFGNALNRNAFRLMTGLSLRDTQTGLRGYPALMLPWLCEIRGDRYEYEMNALLAAVRAGLPLAEVEIATIYLNSNAATHFRSVRDTALTLWPVLAYRR